MSAVFAWIAADLCMKCLRKPAGIAESGHCRDFTNRVLAALNKGNAFTDTIFLQIAGKCPPGQLPEEPAAYFPG